MCVFREKYEKCVFAQSMLKRRQPSFYRNDGVIEKIIIRLRGRRAATDSAKRRAIMKAEKIP
jgi:hypothetical protein